jgi:uncharacterized protein YgbK (DUF1537 family)
MIAVLADDLSGAAELAGAALAHGLAAEVQTQFTADTGARVVCVDTDTRSLPASEAALIVGEIAKLVVAARPEWIYKKCDSVLRGNVLAEIRAIQAATRHTHVLLLSANPGRGRVIRDGRCFIQGELLHQTAFANDPEYPRRSSTVTELLGGDLAGVVTPDVAGPDELLRLASVVATDTLPAGAVEFFEALLVARLGPVACGPGLASNNVALHESGLTLLVCGSAVAWERRREAAVRLGVPVFTIADDAGQIVRALSQHRQALLGIGRATSDSRASPSVLTAQLAELAATLLRDSRAGRVLLEGGASAAALVRRLGWARLRACGPCAPGIGMLEHVSQTGPVLLVKPGSYDWPTTLWGDSPVAARR